MAQGPHLASCILLTLVIEGLHRALPGLKSANKGSLIAGVNQARKRDCALLRPGAPLDLQARRGSRDLQVLRHLLGRAYG